MENNNNIKTNNSDIVKGGLKDILKLYGKCFLVGCTIVSAVTLLKDAVQENEALKKKYGV